ncbi:MAG: glycosyltransferase family 9 protein, partial [Elusimicrobia bacterium]|nr:glycosyltransferase family 9 protein [Elusimicrobiota bacterium]
MAALKARFPAAALDFLAEPPGAQALAGNPHVDRLLVYGPGTLEALAWPWRLRRRRYDWVIDYLGNPRSALLAAASGAPVRAGPAHAAHRWAYNRLLVQSERTCYAGLEKIRVLCALGLSAAGADFMPKVYLARGPAAPADVVALAPASRKPTRRWPAASFAALGRLLRRRLGCELLVLW